MPPTCALLAMAAPTLHENRPFRFLDLPVEIRYIIYELLMGRRVKHRFWASMNNTNTLAERITDITNCYHPAMMRVNKQSRGEYTTIVMSRMMLSSVWLLNVGGRGIVKSICGRHPILLERVFSHLKIFNLTIRRNASCLELGVSLMAPLMRAIKSGMNQLSLVSFTTITPIYNHIRRSYYVQRDFINHNNHGHWKKEMTTSLAAFVGEFTSLTVKAKFTITCNLYFSHPTAAKGTIYDTRTKSAPIATFAICNGPDRDTFELEGLDVKFLGVDQDLISGDSNTQVTLTSKNVLEG